MSDQAAATTASRPRRAAKPHAAKVDLLVVHFTITTKTARPLDIYRATRRLLRRDIAISAAWPSERTIRVSPRLRKAGRPLFRARRLIADFRALGDDPSIWSSILFALKHPVFGVRYVLPRNRVRAVRRDFELLRRSTSVSALVRFVILHPLVGFRHVLPNTKFTRVRKADREGDVELGEREAGQTAPADDLRGAEVKDSSGSDLDESPLDEAEELILNQQMIASAERAIDADLLGGRDRDEDRFVRMELRGTYHDFVIPGENVEGHVVFEPRLLIHETGTVQLTLRIQVSDPGVDSAVLLTIANTPLIVRSQIAEPILRAGHLTHLVKEWRPEKDAGARLGVIEWDHPISMAQMLDIYLQGIASIVGQRLPTWFLIYPTVIVHAGACCAKWEKTHARDMRRIAGRYLGKVPLSEKLDLGTDFSILQDRSMFLNMGSATSFLWRGKHPIGLDELSTTLIVEYAQFLYGRLVALENETTRFRLRERDLRRVYRQAIILFSELRQGNVRYGTARDIVRHLLSELGAPEMHSTIDNALNLAGLSHSTLSASKAARRSFWLALVGTILAVLIGVPSVAQLLTQISGAPSLGQWDWLVQPLRSAAELGAWGPWAVVLGVVLSMVVLWIVTRLWNLRHVRFRWIGRGWAWPTLITVGPKRDDE